ncbi:MAG: hypothetical protein JXX14_11920 [Deltaproteobacteria bacterium]|nr:hypothetical protein [Deltaproteobacteria bacterium]
MNDRLVADILQEARGALNPTLRDRERLHRRVMGSVVAATVATVAGTSVAAKAGGMVAAAGAPIGTIAIFKLTTVGVFIAGIIALGVYGQKSWQPSNQLPKTVAGEQMTKVETTPSGSHRHEKGRPTTLHDDDEQPAQLTLPVVDTGDAGAVVKADNHLSAKEMMNPPATGNITHTARRPVLTNDGKHRLTTGSNRRNEGLAPNDALLLGEIALLRDATRAVGEDDFSTALQRLRQYREKFPTGLMRQESDGLYIRALCGAGQIQAARNAYKLFRSSYKKDPAMFYMRAECTSADEVEQQ